MNDTRCTRCGTELGPEAVRLEAELAQARKERDEAIAQLKEALPMLGHTRTRRDALEAALREARKRATNTENGIEWCGYCGGACPTHPAHVDCPIEPIDAALAGEKIRPLPPHAFVAPPDGADACHAFVVVPGLKPPAGIGADPNSSVEVYCREPKASHAPAPVAEKVGNGALPGALDRDEDCPACLERKAQRNAERLRNQVKP